VLIIIVDHYMISCPPKEKQTLF